MITQIVETLLINSFNKAQRARTAKAAPNTTAVDAPQDAVIIGHIIPQLQTAAPALVSAKLLKSGIVALTPEARKRHLYVLGATGVGKTNLLLHLLESDIRRRRAFCVIDLRGDLVDRILMRLAVTDPPEEWRERLLLLDLRDKEQVVGFNPLAGETDPYNRALHILSVLKQQTESWGVQLEETLRNALVALAHGGWSLLEIEPLLSNAAFRAEVLQQIEDTHVRGFFERFDKLSAASRNTWTLAVLNKVTPLLAIPGLRLMFGQRETFSFRRLLDDNPSQRELSQ
jgi:hypothetical protein